MQFAEMNDSSATDRAARSDACKDARQDADPQLTLVERGACVGYWFSSSHLVADSLVDRQVPGRRAFDHPDAYIPATARVSTAAV